MNSVWWFIGAAVLGIIEIFTLDLTFLMLATGALAGGIVILLGGSLPLAIVIAVAVSTAMLAALRPWLLRTLRLKNAPLIETNTAALVGASAAALDDITEVSGRIKLRGEVWTARVTQGATAIPEGSKVVVTTIEGATAVVALEQEN